MAEFSIDQDKINELVKRVYLAYLHETERFVSFMPQHNLPPELEYSTKQREVKEPLLASQFLLTEAFFERRTQSKQIIKACLAVWNNPDERWIFNPAEVVKRRKALEGLFEIDKVMQKLPYTAHNGNSLVVSDKYRQNARAIMSKFGGDPRNMVAGKTSEEARKDIDSLWGIGNGIANLYISYLVEREIATPLDPRNALLKVDIHKARIPLNIEAVITKERELRRSLLESPLEQAYWKASTDYSFPPEILNGALWVNGSEFCQPKDYAFCQLNCPVADMCKAYTPEDRKTSRFLLRDEQGRRIDARKGGQLVLFPKYAEQTPSFPA
jgi:endonuclease III